MPGGRSARRVHAALRLLVALAGAGMATAPDLPLPSMIVLLATGPMFRFAAGRGD